MTEPHEHGGQETIARTAAATVTSMIALVACARLAGPHLIYYRWHRHDPPTVWNFALTPGHNFRQGGPSVRAKNPAAAVAPFNCAWAAMVGRSVSSSSQARDGDSALPSRT